MKTITQINKEIEVGAEVLQIQNKLVHNYDTTNLELSEIHSIKSVYAACRSELLNFIKASEQEAKTIS